MLSPEVAAITIDVSTFASTWVLHSRTDPGLPAVLHVRELLERIRPVAAAIRAQIERGAKATLRIGVLSDGAEAAVALDTAALAAIAAIPAELVVRCTHDSMFDDLVDVAPEGVTG